MALLFNAFRRLDDAGRELAVACPTGTPRRAFELTALDRQLPMHETRRDALLAIGAGYPPVRAVAAATSDVAVVVS